MYMPAAVFVCASLSFCLVPFFFFNFFCISRAGKQNALGQESWMTSYSTHLGTEIKHVFILLVLRAYIIHFFLHKMCHKEMKIMNYYVMFFLNNYVLIP